uniref:Putative calcium-binding protein CML36 n=1 Tax=Davidia involucrata TaxID=16924 RepID=A0A5B6YFP0_DAVIN
MKLTKLSPKNLFRSKKSPSVSRSDPSSFSFGTSTSESSESSSSIHKSETGKKINGIGTPTSVLPSHSPEISEVSGDWSEISADTYFELVEAFKLIDKDGDGKITREELEALLSGVGAKPPSEEELTMMLSEVDRDGDGCISLEEFGAIRSAFEPPACDSELRDAFNVFDTDHDGRITAEELHGVFKAIGDEQCTLEDCRRMIIDVDKNGDGFVCFEDFTRMMEQR